MEQVKDVVYITPEVALTSSGILVSFVTGGNTKLGSVVLPNKNTRTLTQTEVSEAWNVFVDKNLDPSALPGELCDIMRMYQTQKKNVVAHENLTWRCTFVRPGYPWSIKMVRNATT